jgi:hypothetical protein
MGRSLEAFGRLLDVHDLLEATVAVLFMGTVDSTALITAAMRRTPRCQKSAPLREHPLLRVIRSQTIS